MLAEVASVRDVFGRALLALKPPPRRDVSNWADEKFYLSAESSAEAGKWTSMPFQRGIMNAFSDVRVTYISCMKSARVGWTKILNIVIAKHIDEDPCSIMLVQPTIGDAEGYSKEEIAPMLRDVPCLHGKVSDAKTKDADNTILSKRYPGGVLGLVGANSGTGFRRVARRLALGDEIDAYPPSAGDDGDQYALMEKRTLWFWNRKIGAGSTPLIRGTSRIEKLYLAGDQRRYYVPCPHCDHMDYLVFSRVQGDDDEETLRTDAGHVMTWPEGKPEQACFVCSGCGCEIYESHKVEMVERGEWRASQPFTNHASFHIWAAYSFAPNATWGQIATEFIAAKKGGSETLRTFVNTVLGQTWRESGEAPEWERLYNRRESYAIGSVPRGVLFITAGVDVQKDRLVYEVVGWGRGKESWSIDAAVIPGDTATDAPWAKLDDVRGRSYVLASGAALPISCMAVDAGYNSQTVYNWCRRYPMPSVIAVRGVETGSVLIGSPSPVDVTANGKKLKRGYKVWPVLGSVGKSELYGWLKLSPPADDVTGFPPGYCHAPEYSEDFFKQLTAEQLVARSNRKGYIVRTWEKIPGRENHHLDARIYARSAAAVMQIDRLTPAEWARLETVAAGEVGTPALPSRPTTPQLEESRDNEETQPAARPAPPARAGSWISPRPGGWLNKR